MLANPKEEVLVYDTESWAVWKEVWDTFERDGVPRTEDLNTMQRYALFTESVGIWILWFSLLSGTRCSSVMSGDLDACGGKQTEQIAHTWLGCSGIACMACLWCEHWGPLTLDGKDVTF